MVEGSLSDCLLSRLHTSVDKNSWHENRDLCMVQPAQISRCRTNFLRLTAQQKRDYKKIRQGAACWHRMSRQSYSSMKCATKADLQEDLCVRSMLTSHVRTLLYFGELRKEMYKARWLLQSAACRECLDSFLCPWNNAQDECTRKQTSAKSSLPRKPDIVHLPFEECATKAQMQHDSNEEEPASYAWFCIHVLLWNAQEEDKCQKDFSEEQPARNAWFRTTVLRCTAREDAVRYFEHEIFKMCVFTLSRLVQIDQTRFTQKNHRSHWCPSPWFKCNANFVVSDNARRVLWAHDAGMCRYYKPRPACSAL